MPLATVWRTDYRESRVEEENCKAISIVQVRDNGGTDGRYGRHREK